MNTGYRAGTAAIHGWTVRWTLSAGQTISHPGALSVSDSSVTVRNESWNGSLGANGSTTFGFLRSGSPSTPAFICTNP